MYIDRSTWKIALRGVLSMLMILFLFASCEQQENGESKPDTPPNGKGQVTTPPEADEPEINVSEADKEACKAVIEEMMEYVRKGKNKKVAKLLVYRGEDEERKWKDVYSYAPGKDQEFVDKSVAKMQVLMEGLESHDYVEFLAEKEFEGVWHVWIVDMKYEDGRTKKTAFAMLKVGDRFALGDIE